MAKLFSDIIFNNQCAADELMKVCGITSHLYMPYKYKNDTDATVFATIIDGSPVVVCVDKLEKIKMFKLVKNTFVEFDCTSYAGHGLFSKVFGNSYLQYNSCYKGNFGDVCGTVYPLHLGNARAPIKYALEWITYESPERAMKHLVCETQAEVLPLIAKLFTAGIVNVEVNGVHVSHTTNEPAQVDKKKLYFTVKHGNKQSLYCDVIEQVKNDEEFLMYSEKYGMPKIYITQEVDVPVDSVV